MSTKKKKVAIPASEWKWFGFSAHFICGEWCRFHMATQIGDVLVSTIGKYVPPSQSGSEKAESAFLAKNPNGDTVGCWGHYETLVFKAGKPCANKKCMCGLPAIVGGELDGKRYETAGAATKGHMAFCNKWSAGGGE